MKRLWICLGTLSFFSKLQILAVTLILGFFAWIDYHGGKWPVTIAIVSFASLIGWLLLPLMMAHQNATLKIFSAFGIVVFGTYVLVRNEWWWHTWAAHFGRELAMWMDMSCGYWFISEVRLRQDRQLAELLAARDGEATVFADHQLDRANERLANESARPTPDRWY